MMKDSSRLPTRAIVRGIPPNISSSHLFNQLDPPAVNHFYIKRGEFPQRAVAYLNFDKPAILLTFLQKCPSTFEAEVAPNQKIIRVRKSPWHDPLVNTIESDPHYQRFVENLTQSSSISTPHVEITRSPNKKHEKLTPLLKYMIEKKKLDNLKPNNKNCIVFVNSAKKRKYKTKHFKKEPIHAQ